jgi:hypothetical protein
MDEDLMGVFEWVRFLGEVASVLQQLNLAVDLLFRQLLNVVPPVLQRGLGKICSAMMVMDNVADLVKVAHLQLSVRLLVSV